MGTAIGEPANEFTLYIYLTNGNKSVKANFVKTGITIKRISFHYDLLDFLKISENFLKFSRIILKLNKSSSKITIFFKTL